MVCSGGFLLGWGETPPGRAGAPRIPLSCGLTDSGDFLGSGDKGFGSSPGLGLEYRMFYYSCLGFLEEPQRAQDEGTGGGGSSAGSQPWLDTKGHAGLNCVAGDSRDPVWPWWGTLQLSPYLGAIRDLSWSGDELQCGLSPDGGLDALETVPRGLGPTAGFMAEFWAPALGPQIS